MLKFWKKNKQQPEQARDVGEEGSTDQEQPLNSLEEVLKPLFERTNPTALEEYAVPVAEVERLWSRYQQLGLNDQQTLPNGTFQQQPYATDPFVKQIWRTFPRDENGNVTFHSFVGVLMWWKTAPLDKRLAGIFKLLNKSQPLDVPALQQIIMNLDSSLDEETAKSKAELLVKTLDDKDQGYIDVDQWVNWALQLPEDEIAKLTKFVIIPEEMDAQTPYSRSENQSSIPNELLVDIAGKIGERDWTPLARELGFTKHEIREVKKKYPHRSREQVYQVLVLWRQKMGQEATADALELSLSKSGMETQ
ncbi:uncharacterized protein LOC144666841 isoform X2 [Oculina patagonica]